MAVITITASSVVPGVGTVQEASAGEVIAAGDTVAVVSGVAYKADSDHATAARAVVAGIAVNSALAIGQPVHYQTNGTVTVGAVLEKGLPYFQSQTAGKICLASDLTAGARASLVGFAATTSTLTLARQNSGIQFAAQVNVATVTPGNGSDTNEVQSVEIVYATGGTFTLTFEGQTTAALAYDCSAGDLETALEALSNLTAITVTGSGTRAAPFLVSFDDDFTNQDQMTATSSLTPT